MKIAVIGATGLVGNATVLELAARGHQVTAFARNVAKVAQHQNVTAVAADVNAPDFASKLAGFDAVVSAFNAGWDNPNLAQDVKTGYDNLLAAFKTANLPYYLIVGGAGSLNVAPNLQLVDTPDFPADVYPTADALRVLLDDLRPRRDINWAFLSPAAMFGGKVSFEKQGAYRIGKDDVLLNADGSPADITLPDLAAAIADDVEQKAHLFQRFTVAN
ncbi:NAD(P)-dependent oxidoreductase [Kingella oralis]|uniref:NAD(P)-dependent oxidoreductase n=1 Tax=Kingella oralis TaxID=505 RepID=UPI002D807560|nr:NAD(P)H-binding protein [Kingella oralis]